MIDYKETLLCYLSSRRLELTTINRYLYMLKKYENWCYSQGVRIEEMPPDGLLKFMSEGTSASDMKSRKGMLINIYTPIGQGFKTLGLPHPIQRVRIPESLTPNQVYDIIRAINNPKQRLAIKLMYLLGLRVTEAMQIKLENFRHKVNHKTGEYYWVVRIIGKGNKERVVPVNDLTKAEIDNFCKDANISEGYLFKGQFRSSYSTASIQKVFKRAKIKCGISVNGNTHLLRKSRAQFMSEINISDSNIMDIFGWSCHKTMKYYRKANTEAMQESMSIADVKLVGYCDIPHLLIA